MEQNDNQLLHLKSQNYLLSFFLISACFAIWGFATNVTTPMTSSFSKIFRMGATEASMVQAVFNLGYFCMAFPAALLIQRYTYKSGIITGLFLYAAGALLFIPARWTGMFYPFLGAYFTLTCGLSFLETSCSPYIFSMGSERTGIQRLNGAQAFNALGSIAGMFIAMSVQSHLSPMDKELRNHLPLQQFNLIKDHDLGVLIQPYVYIGAIVVLLLVLVALKKLPGDTPYETKRSPSTILRELLHSGNYREGVLSLFCYTGAQVTCWSYIIIYGTRVFMAEGMEEINAEILSQKYNILAMVLFASSRIICTWLMRWFSPSRMLSFFGILGIAAVCGTILFTDRNGVYCLVLVSVCLSLMFPTIYGIALVGTGENIKIAGAGLIMALLGGTFFAPLQAAIIESNITVLSLPSTNISFFIPLVCLCVVVWYGHRSFVRHRILVKKEEY